jgi:hypothetical protein
MTEKKDRVNQHLKKYEPLSQKCKNLSAMKNTQKDLNCYEFSNQKRVLASKNTDFDIPYQDGTYDSAQENYDHNVMLTKEGIRKFIVPIKENEEKDESDYIKIVSNDDYNDESLLDEERELNIKSY